MNLHGRTIVILFPIVKCPVASEYVIEDKNSGRNLGVLGAEVRSSALTTARS